MIKPLRKRHLQIWITWAVLLPAGIIVAWLAVPQKSTDRLLQPDNGIALPVKLKSEERKNYKAILRTTIDSSLLQLEWVNKEISTLPSSLIYKTGKPENELVGRIEATGTYYFPLRKDTTGNYNFILYDIIKKQIIDSLNLGQ